MEPQIILGRTIREERLRLALTQEDLGHETGLNASAVSKAERGAQDPRLSTIVKLAAGLGISTADLLRDV